MKFLLMLPVLVLAHSFEMGTIKGPGIDLHSQGHTLTGKIGKTLFFGQMSERTKETNIVLSHNDQITQGFFKRDGQSWKGTASNNSMQFLRLDRDTNTYTFMKNGKEMHVRVESRDFSGNHFIDPEFILETESGEFRVTTENVKSCYMYTMHLIFMIFSTL